MILKRIIRREGSYSEILKIQNKEFEYRLQCRKDGIPLPEDTVLFVEHNPVYTIGLHGNQDHLLLSEEILKIRGIEFHKISRGGDITYHGPGQVTVYPILDMLRYGFGVKNYVGFLEETVMKTLLEYNIKGDRIEGKTGVWIGKGTPNERKICAIGIKCSRFISMHGFALNYGRDLSHFDGINPCGLNKGVTSLALETGRDVEFEEIVEKLWRNLNALLRLRILSQENS